MHYLIKDIALNICQLNQIRTH